MIKKIITAVCGVFILTSMLQVTAFAQSPNVNLLPTIINFILNESSELGPGSTPDPQCVGEVSGTTFIGDCEIVNQDGLDQLKGITVLQGSLIIAGANSATGRGSLLPGTTSLDFTVLSSLQIVIGVLEIFDTELTSIVGFDSLVSVGGNLSFVRNFALTQLSEFEALEFVGDSLAFDDNDALTEIRGFSSLTTVLDSVRIDRQVALTDVSGFESLTTISNSLRVRQNTILINLPDFLSLLTIGGSFRFEDNLSLRSLPSLGSPVSVGRSFVTGNILFDCSIFEPSFVPLTNSFDNLVDCPIQ